MLSFYAVRRGRQPGVYLSWDDCKAQTAGYSGAVYKKFKTLGEAQAFMQADVTQPCPQRTQGAGKTSGEVRGDVSQPCHQTIQKAFKTSGEVQYSVQASALQSQHQAGAEAHAEELQNLPLDHCLAYVDGSFNVATDVYGYGVILLTHQGPYEFQGNGTDAELASMRNVSGEIYGSMRAVTEALRLGFSAITIYYDYMGIECWANGSWKTNKQGTANYKAFMQQHSRLIDIRFQKVRAHTGVYYNEAVDRLAKQAVGLL